MPVGFAKAIFTNVAGLPTIDGSTFQKSFSSPIDTWSVNIKSDDGTKMFVGSQTQIRQFDLGTAWDVGSTTYGGLYDISTEDNLSGGVFFKSDGTKFYTVGAQYDYIYQYSMSTAWDITTASYDSVSIDISARETSAQGLFIKPDGTKLYVVGLNSDTVFQYGMSTPWDLSTATYDNLSFGTTSQEINPNDVFFSSNGNRMYLVGTDTDTVYEYALSTSWNVATASYTNKSFDVSTQTGLPRGLFIKPDGTKMFIADSANDDVHQYSIS